MKSSQEIVNEDIKGICDRTDLNGFRGRKVLLTGASGLLGSYFSHLFGYLNSEQAFGMEVDLITRNVLGPNSSIWDLKDTPGFIFITRDLSQPAAYEKGYDFVIHAAGYGAPAVFLQDPFKTMDVNYIGIKSILESMSQLNPKARILYLSSSEVYGSPEPEHIPTPETYAGSSPVTSNRACYIESKRLSESLCLAYATIQGMHIRIARPALSYGPGLTFLNERVLSQFMKKAYLHKVINMVDDGRDLRCYCYLSDAISQLLNILLFSKDTIYNVGSAEEEISILELANMIGNKMGAQITPGPGKDASVINAPSRVRLDLRKLESEFGLKPIVKMSEGLQRTIDWNLALIREHKLTVQ